MTSEREQLFGRDLQLAPFAGGLSLQANGLGDLALAQGNANITQALLLRLHVRQGELARLGWPNYGSRIHELIGEPNTARTHTRLLAYVREALVPDPRVQAINTVQAQVIAGERNVVRVQAEVQLITRPEPLNLVFDVNLEQL